MNLFTKQIYTHRHRKQTYGYQRGKGGRDKLGVWDINIYTLLYIKQITNKDLLYSTGNYTQCFVYSIYIKLNHFAVNLKVTQHCKPTILQFKKRKKIRNRQESSLSHNRVVVILPHSERWCSFGLTENWTWQPPFGTSEVSKRTSVFRKLVSHRDLFELTIHIKIIPLSHYQHRGELI